MPSRRGVFELTIPVREVMTKHIIKLPESSTIREAVKLMAENQISCVLVVDKKGKLAGVFTERDVLVKVALKKANPSKTTVDKIMTKNVETASPDESIFEIAKHLSKRKFRRFPIVKNGDLKGLITETDIVLFSNKEMEKLVKMQKSLIIVIFIMALLILIYSLKVFQYAATL